MRFFIAMLAGVLVLAAGAVTGLVWLMVLGGVVWALAVILWIAAPSGGPEPSGRNPNTETIAGEWIAGSPATSGDPGSGGN